MHDFIKTNEINLLEIEINNLKNQLIDKKSTLSEMIEIEFEKQFNLEKGKTILKDNKGEYVYAGFDEISFLWIKGFSFNKNGKVSLRTKNLYTDWEYTGKEYNNGTKETNIRANARII